MKVCDSIRCEHFPCAGVDHAAYCTPSIDIDPAAVRLILLSEAAAPGPGDGYYAPGNPLFARTTLLAFEDAGFPARSIEELVDRGIYLTTAVKCAKTAYAVPRPAIEECSRLLEKELALFPKVNAFLLIGDVAIQAVNLIARRAGEPRPIPAGSTYKIRGGNFRFSGFPVFPSYLQAGPAFFIEKSKRRMIAEDIAAALQAAGIH